MPVHVPRVDPHHYLPRAHALQLDEKLSDFEFPDDFVLDVYEMVNA